MDLGNIISRVTSAFAGAAPVVGGGPATQSPVDVIAGFLPPDQANVVKAVGAQFQSMLNGGPAAPIVRTAPDAAKAGTAPGVSDSALAKQNAQKVIDSIDWSKPEVALWVPGTGSRGVPGQFRDAAGPNASTVAIEYPATTAFMNSVSTGMETTEIVLAEAKKRGKPVLLGGHSQGAWVAGEVMAKPESRDAVKRAVLYGHPSVANAQFDDGHDPKVREINNADDPYGLPMTGGGVDAVQAISNLSSGHVDPMTLLGLGRAALENPKIAGYLLGQRRPDGSDPHGYNFASEAAFLRS